MSIAARNGALAGFGLSLVSLGFRLKVCLGGVQNAAARIIAANLRDAHPPLLLLLQQHMHDIYSGPQSGANDYMSEKGLPPYHTWLFVLLLVVGSLFLFRGIYIYHLAKRIYRLSH